MTTEQSLAWAMGLARGEEVEASDPAARVSAFALVAIAETLVEIRDLLVPTVEVREEEEPSGRVLFALPTTATGEVDLSSLRPVIEDAIRGKGAPTVSTLADRIALAVGGWIAGETS